MDDFVLVDDFGPFKPPAASASTTSFSASHYDDMFDSYFNRSAEPAEPSPSSSAPSPPPPVFDKPVFDDADADAADPFDAIPLFGDGGDGGEGEDFLDSLGKGAKKPDVSEPEVVGFDDDLIPALGNTKSKTPVGEEEVEQEAEAVGFVDDVIPEWFGGSASTTPMKPTPQAEPKATGFEDDVIPGEEPRTRPENESISSSKTSVSMPGDAFVTLGSTSNLGNSNFGLFTDHLDNMGKSESKNMDPCSTANGMFDSSNIFVGVPKPMSSSSFASEKESVFGDSKSLDGIYSMNHSIKMPKEKPVQQASAETISSILPEMHIHEAPGTTGFNNSDPLSTSMQDQLPEENQCSKMSDDVWLTVSDVVLVTQPTSAPPPSRPPPTLAAKKGPTESNTSNAYPHDHNQGYNPFISSTNTSKTPKIDELEDFVMAKPSSLANGCLQDLNHNGIGIGQDSSTSAAGFMDWAELKHSKGVNQGNFDSLFASSQYQEKEKAVLYASGMESRDEEELLEHEKKQREKEEEQRKLERDREEELEREREMMRRREHEERKRREKEREARHIVEKAMREARERAAAEARMQAEREARQRAERAAVQKAAAEARERAAAEARERAAKAAAEVKERPGNGQLQKLGKRQQQKLGLKLSELLLIKLQQKHEEGLKEQQLRGLLQKLDKGLLMKLEKGLKLKLEQEKVSRKQLNLISTHSLNPFDVQPQGGSDFGSIRRTSSGSASPFAQPPSTNLMDDLSSIFGAPSSSAVFQEVDGESEERRKARLERHQRTMERAAKALAEKNERDLQVQWEQEERHRIGETLDFEIKRWAAGKEGNLRALLSTLQYVLWPECGWRPVSLTDLITAASVKKEYRKATLCIHPDKVQQKGANLQQKYIAEKVFDLLKV
uniref:J domain-containing protein n=1 Tax=Oryza glumipatula TaxID=40148 RepID=A0A0D9Y8A4_9ORYZ